MILVQLLAVLAPLGQDGSAPASGTASGSDSASDSGPVVLTLPLEAHVMGTEIELGEVARLDGPAEAVERLRALSLGYAPAPGYSRLVRVDQIVRALERKAPELVVQFTGQRATRVWPEVETVTGEALQQAAEEALRGRFAGREVALALRGTLPALDVPKSAGGAVLRARVETAGASGASVAVDVLVDGGLYRTAWTNWKAEEWRQVPVLSKPVALGEAFTPAHFTWQRAAVGADGDTPLTPDALVGAVSLRALAPGEAVRAGDVRRALAVFPGAGLTLAVRKGAIEARVAASALDGAAIGDRLRVRTADGAQELTARLVAPDLAVIDLGR